ncbi:MAG: bifunctional folylpolyglutamate synthase/dihydrofolate synthase [Parvicellaceae bacterium]
MKTYQEVIAFLYEQYPTYQNKGINAYKPDLSNIIKLCEIAGNPQKNIKTIHVAGTNGKGSVCNYLTNIYTDSGYRVGTFSSPHLIDFRERITINQNFIEKEFIVDFYHQYLAAFEEVTPSFFEWSTVLAFKYFENQKTEINIIETGLGGRLDSTNIIEPELAIITTVGKDHQNILGNTLHDIAKEKAGIIKNATPTLLGADIKETKYIFEEIAQQNNSNIYQAKESRSGTSFLPIYQLNNWNTALKATDILKNRFNIKPTENKPASYLTINGRWQVLAENPKTIADIGHNVQGMEAIKKQIINEEYEHLHVILGFSGDKNIEAIISKIPKANYYYLTQSNNERSVPAEELKKIMNNDKSETFSHYSKAYQAVKKRAKQNDLVLITGSAFLVGDILHDFY